MLVIDHSEHEQQHRGSIRLRAPDSPCRQTSVAALTALRLGGGSVAFAPVDTGEITLILQRVQRGEEKAAERLLPLVYDELRRLAAARMSHERAGHTLQPTALVHEAWIRLGADQQPDWQSRAQFFAAAAEAMRRILIDGARRRLAQRRGGRVERVNIDDVEVANTADDARVVRVNAALEKFAVTEPEKASLVKLRYFGGFTLEESAQALGIAEPTARRWWAYSRAWLISEMSAPE